MTGQRSSREESMLNGLVRRKPSYATSRKKPRVTRRGVNVRRPSRVLVNQWSTLNEQLSRNIWAI